MKGGSDVSEHSSLSKTLKNLGSGETNATPWIYGMELEGFAYSMTRRQLVKCVKSLASEERQPTAKRQSDHAPCHPSDNVTVTCMYTLHSCIPRSQQCT